MRHGAFLNTSFEPQLINPLSVNFTKWTNALKQFVSNLPTNCLSVFGHFVGLALKWLIKAASIILETGNFLRKTEDKFTFQKGNISAYYSTYSPMPTFFPSYFKSIKLRRY